MLRRHDREVARAVRKMPFPFYGLPPDWDGRRGIGGSSFGKKTGLSRINLTHSRGVGPSSSTVTVDNESGRFDSIEWHRYDMEERTGLRSFFADDGSDEPLHESEWSSIELPVDGAPVEFALVRGELSQWSAIARLGAVIVTVSGRYFEPKDVELQTVTDVEPYIRGQKEFMASLRRRR
jgi:hypothetical protein